QSIVESYRFTNRCKRQPIPCYFTSTIFTHFHTSLLQYHKSDTFSDKKCKISLKYLFGDEKSPQHNRYGLVLTICNCSYTSTIVRTMSDYFVLMFVYVVGYPT